MEISPDIIGHVFSLPPQDRYELAHHLLDSIDDIAAADLDRTFVEELKRRRDEMLIGSETVIDWRASLSTLENRLSSERPR